MQDATAIVTMKKTCVVGGGYVDVGAEGIPFFFRLSSGPKHGGIITMCPGSNDRRKAGAYAHKMSA